MSTGGSRSKQERTSQVSTPKTSPTKRSPATLGGTFGVSPNGSKRGKDQK